MFDHDVNLMRWRDFSPFADPSIPYGLIGGKGVFEIVLEQKYTKQTWFVAIRDRYNNIVNSSSESKTHAIIKAYCDADPLGHWFNFIQDEND